ncbi:M23 family metallopeptidase [Solibacillus sp. FSL H8-0523]|uniref:M23 family metallopeptidase n=1 Tax=Solibacillus sp. FSL H8-0523 TaxID=2954511 RepID=UPI003101373F
MYPITSRFNSHEHFRKAPHKGYDFAMEKGTQLKAVVDGEIQIIDYGNSMSGKTVIIKGTDGLTYMYGHLSEFKVKVGDFVKQGDLLGLSGNSGNVYGSNGGFHLDFRIRNEQGQFIDPAPYVEFIQNMNNPQYMNSLLADTIQKGYEINLENVMQQFSDGLSNINIFDEIKLNTISMLLRFLF